MQHKPARGHILFVDDDAFFRELAQAALTEVGFTVSLASGGQDAVAAIARQHYDLVVLDLGMPIVSGYEVLETIRGPLQKSDLPVLVITGNDDAASVQRAFDIGATSFLAKPLNWLLFVHHVNFVLKSARTQSALRDASRAADLMSRLKSRLVGALMTEFQAPLRSAYSVSTLLKHEADGPIQSELYRSLITDLHRSVDQLNATHLKMLNFGRSLAEGVTLDETLVDPAELLASAVETVAERARRRQIDIRLDVRVPGELRFNGDRILLGQVIGTILANSVQFSRRGATVVVGAVLASNEGITLTVADSATNLTKANIDEILGVASSSGSISAEAVDHSTGLRLARVLVEAHEGRMTLKGDDGEGLLAEVWLPKSRVRSPSTLAHLTGGRTESPRAASTLDAVAPAPRRLLA